MRVLWFVVIPFPEVRQHLGLKLGGRGWWMVSLRDVLLVNTKIELGIALLTRAVRKPFVFDATGVKYFIYPSARHFSISARVKQDLETCKLIVEDFKPDIIHVHGTEAASGLIAGRVYAPVMVSIQGILSEYANIYFGHMRLIDVIRHPVDYLLQYETASAARDAGSTSL